MNMWVLTNVGDDPQGKYQRLKYDSVSIMFLRTLAKLRKTTTVYVTSVRLSVRRLTLDRFS